MRRDHELLDWMLIISEIVVVACAGLAVRRLTDLFIPEASSWILLLILIVFVIIVLVADRVLRMWLKRQTWQKRRKPSEHDE